jgi:CO/xanthine dehydrogenase FAD-binding subunit
LQGRTPRAPATLHEANGLGFLHRERARFFAGRSDILDLSLEPGPSDGFVIDVRGIAELTAVRVTDAATMIGAFAPLAAVCEHAALIAPEGTTASALRLRLSLLDAKLVVAGLGRTRSAPLDALNLAPHELPTLIEVPPTRGGTGFADRRRTITDRDASFTLGISVALRISALGRFENVRIVIDFDDALARAQQAEAKLEKQPVDPGLFAEAARLAAFAIESTDARTSSAARSVTPLVMAALRDALAAARG